MREPFEHAPEPNFSGLPDGSREQHDESTKLLTEAERSQTENPETLLRDTEEFLIEYSKYFTSIKPNEVVSAINALSSGESNEALEISQKLESYLHGHPRHLPPELITALGGNSQTFNEVLDKLEELSKYATVLTYRLGSIAKM
jgi:hypothetical protein